MKTTVITTIAQRWKGAGLHLRNLRWACPGARIVCQHFACHEMPELGLDIEFIPHDTTTAGFHFFWDHVYPLIDDADLFVFTEQDILITMPLVAPTDRIKLTYESDYLSIFKDGKHQYPRIWDGYTAVPGDYVRKAKEEGINFGNNAWVAKDRWKYDGLKTYYNRWIDLHDYVHEIGGRWHEGDFDTVYEFSLWCYFNNVPYTSTNQDGYQLALDAVHFRGMDRLLLDCPGVYDDPKKIFNPCPQKLGSRRVYLEMVNDAAVLLALSCGMMEWSIVATALRMKKHRERTRRKLATLIRRIGTEQCTGGRIVLNGR